MWARAFRAHTVNVHTYRLTLCTYSQFAHIVCVRQEHNGGLPSLALHARVVHAEYVYFDLNIGLGWYPYIGLFWCGVCVSCHERKVCCKTLCVEVIVSSICVRAVCACLAYAKSVARHTHATQNLLTTTLTWYNHYRDDVWLKYRAVWRLPYRAVFVWCVRTLQRKQGLLTTTPT